MGQNGYSDQEIKQIREHLDAGRGEDVANLGVVEMLMDTIDRLNDDLETATSSREETGEGLGAISPSVAFEEEEIGCAEREGDYVLDLQRAFATAVYDSSKKMCLVCGRKEEYGHRHDCPAVDRKAFRRKLVNLFKPTTKWL